MMKFKYMDKELLYFDINSEIISLHKNGRIHLMYNKSQNNDKRYLYVTADDLMKERDKDFKNYLNKWFNMLSKLNMDLNVSIYKGNIVLFKQVKECIFIFVLHDKGESPTIYIVNNVNQDVLNVSIPKVKYIVETNEYNQMVRSFSCNNITKMKYIISCIARKLKSDTNIKHVKYSYSALRSYRLLPQIR